MAVKTTIQHRRDLAATWTTQLLAPGEIGVEYDTGKFKVGTGTAAAAWNTLPYAIAGSSALATSATTSVNITGGALGSLPYQSGVGATSFLAASGTTGLVLVNTAGAAPSWSKLSFGVTSFNTVVSDAVASIVSDQTGWATTGDKLVFNNAPAIRNGVGYTGATSGVITLVAPSVAGASVLTLPLPYSGTTGTLITNEAAIATYIPIAGATSISNAISSSATFTSSAQVQGATLKAAGLTTAGIATNTSAGVLGTVASVPVANGGTGGTDVPSGRAGLRVYVQSADPTTTGVTPQANDLWFW